MNTRTPSRSKTRSFSRGASAQSMVYDKPEHPPPFTAIRRPAVEVPRSSISFRSCRTAASVIPKDFAPAFSTCCAAPCGGASMFACSLMISKGVFQALQSAFLTWTCSCALTAHRASFPSFPELGCLAVEGRLLTQVLHLLGDQVRHVLDLLLGVKATDAEADRAVGRLLVYATCSQDVRRL